MVEARLADRPRDPELSAWRVELAAKAGRCDLALEQAARRRREEPRTARDFHRLGRGYALCGKASDALAVLREAVNLGLPPETLSQERELSSLRERAELRRLTVASPLPR